VASESNNSGIVNFAAGNAGTIEAAGDSRHAMPARHAPLNLFRAVCLQRRPDSAQGAPLTQ
jgi:hypothetical protein